MQQANTRNTVDFVSINIDQLNADLRKLTSKLRNWIMTLILIGIYISKLRRYSRKLSEIKSYHRSPNLIEYHSNHIDLLSILGIDSFKLDFVVKYYHLLINKVNIIQIKVKKKIKAGKN